MTVPLFSHGEIEPVRVPKLNRLGERISALETNGTGGTSLALDGGDASSSGAAGTMIDGGSA